MKKIVILVLGMLSITLISTQSKNKYYENRIKSEITDESILANIKGGCSCWLEDLAAAFAVLNFALNPTPANGLNAAEKTLKAQICHINCGTSGGSGGGGSCDPCPNGGGLEPYWACQQNGGYSSGSPTCGSYSSDLVCCQY